MPPPSDRRVEVEEEGGNEAAQKTMSDTMKKNIRKQMTIRGLSQQGSRSSLTKLQKTASTNRKTVAKKDSKSTLGSGDGSKDDDDTLQTSTVEDQEWENIFADRGLSAPQQESETGQKYWVDGKRFNIFIGSAVALNSVVIGIDTDVNSSGNPSMAWQVMDSVFAVIWVSEVVFKVYYYRLLYFSKGWNRLDFFLACLAVVEAWVLRAMKLDDAAKAGDFSAWRIVRIARMLRLLRLLKMLRMIDEVWMIVQGFIQALRTLIWVFVLLFLCIYSSAVYMTTIVGQTCDMDYRKQGIEFDDCEYLFGQVHMSMLTLFQVITLDAWSEVVARSVLRGKPYLYAFFLVFLFFTTFGLLNIVVGVIVENTLNISDNNKKLQAQRQEAKLRKELEALRDVFDEADTDGSGGVDREEFHEVMKRADVQQLFSEMELPFNEPDTLYEIFDVEKVGVLSINAFVDGAIKFKGPPTGFELRSMTIDVKGMAGKVEKIEHMLQELHVMPGSEADASSSLNPNSDDISLVGTLRRQGTQNSSQSRHSSEHRQLSEPQADTVSLPKSGNSELPEQGDANGCKESVTERCDVIDQTIREVRSEQTTLFSEVQRLLGLARPIAKTMGIDLTTPQTPTPSSSADVVNGVNGVNGVNSVNGVHDAIHDVNGVHDNNGFSTVQDERRNSDSASSNGPRQRSTMELMRFIEKRNQLLQRDLDMQVKILEKAMGSPTNGTKLEM